MRCLWMLCLTLAVQSPAADQLSLPDSQAAQAMLSEIRGLRQDLRNTSATMQRAQILMYRLQAQEAALDKAAGRLEQARNGCKQAQSQQKFLASQIEHVEAGRRNIEGASDQAVAEQVISQLRSSLEASAAEAQQCQVELVDAETQFRAEQAKTSELQDQLDQLDQALAAYGSK